MQAESLKYNDKIHLGPQLNDMSALVHISLPDHIRVATSAASFASLLVA